MTFHDSAGGFPRTIRSLSSAYASGSILPTEAVRGCLRRIDAVNPRLNCFITVLKDSALKAAEAADLRYKEGRPLGPLDGVPIAVKDIMFVQGVKCTAGSRILEQNVADYDASVVRRLRAAGAVLVGTTNLHEFAAGVTSDNPHFGAVRNPWDGQRDAGGSSGGSAVAVASGLVAGALGTDTAGSVRIPAALCGVLGFKPTYGRVSRLGVVPLAASFDTVGLLASSARDVAELFMTIAGHEANDMTTVGTEVPDLTEAISSPFAGARVGVPRGFFHDLIDPRAEASVEGFISRLKEIGCRVGDVELDGVSEAYEKWLPIRQAEATAFHLKWLESSPQLYGEDVRRLLELGRKVLAVDYVNSLNARPSFIERFSSSMEGFDLLVLPTTCVPAPKLGEPKATIRNSDVDVRTALLRLTVPFNYVGFPAISVPSGLVDSLPFGVQIVGRLFDEVGVLRVVNALEAKFGLSPSPPSGN